MHNERCPKCKDVVEKMLRAIYGEVRRNFRIELGTLPEDYAGQPVHAPLSAIYSALGNYRGFKEFVRARYVDVDFFVPSAGFVVEFDESQHFTRPRKISLENYPAAKETGYQKERWIGCCDELDKRDNDPPFRDEQRAWFDALRDFLPEIQGFQPTLRLYAGEMEWCRMDPTKTEDVEKFKKILVNSGSKINLLNDTKFLNDQILANPVIDEIIRYEYLTNLVKLQYLLDCITGEFDHNSRYLSNHKEKTRLLNSGGEPFKVYLNRYIRNKGYFGPLFSDRDPWKYEIIAELGTVNDSLKNIISSSDDWFALFCEYTLIKTSLHELTADVHDPENIDKYGYPDLMYLSEIENKPGLSGSILRNFVVSCLNLGINPSEEHESAEQEVSHLAGCKYAELQSRRKEWIKHAWHLINRIKTKISTQNLSSVMQWQSYALCAYETGPVFIRKKRELILPGIAHSFEAYHKWDQARLRENLYEIIGQHVTFVIENYWDHFDGKQTIDFLKGNSDLAIEIKKREDRLKSLYGKISSEIVPTESIDSEREEISSINISQSKNWPIPEIGNWQIDKK